MATDGAVNRWNGVAYAASDERLLSSGLWMPGASTAPFSARAGRRVNGTGLSVSVGGAPEAWTVTPGWGVIYDAAYAAQGPFNFEIPAAKTANMPARPATGLSRIDLIVARIYDTDIGVGAVKEVKIELVPGDAASPATAPAIPALSLVLATLSVPAAGAITVTQSTQRTVAAGGILPVATTAERDALPNPWRGLVVDNAQTGRIEHFNGTAWKQLREVDDTGWLDNALTAATDWTITKQATSKADGRVDMQLAITYTGPTVAVTGDGNITNLKAFSMAAAYRPFSTAALSVADGGRLAAFGGWYAGDIYLGALAPPASLVAGTAWSLQGSWKTA